MVFRDGDYKNEDRQHSNGDRKSTIVLDYVRILEKRSLLTTIVKTVAIIVVQHALLQWSLSNFGYNKISSCACHMI